MNDIINTLKSNNLVEFINYHELSKLIKESYINIDYSNNMLGLSNINNGLINIVLLETNSIIGNIKMDYDIKINVDEKYLKDSLDLISKFFSYNKAKKLIKK